MKSTAHFLEAIAATQEFADAIATLAASGLSKHLSASLKVLAQLEAQAKELQESQTRDDLVILTGTGIFPSQPPHSSSDQRMA